MGIVRTRTGARAHYSPLSNIFATRDGQWLTIVGTSGATYGRIFEAMGRADLLHDERFASPAARLRHGEVVDQMVADWCRGQDLATLEAVLREKQVPHSKVYDIEDALADPQFRARKAVIELPDPELGPLAAPGVVPRFSGYGTTHPRSGPGVGEHNAEVYGALGLQEQDLAELHAHGVI
jgi:crotonobetainyl-CoA:carnitine CoA-transferase CaiB-like acyl-CoA transferase